MKNFLRDCIVLISALVLSLIFSAPALGRQEEEDAVKGNPPSEFSYNTSDFFPVGERFWRSVEYNGRRFWFEFYKDDQFSFFPVLGRDTVDDCSGEILLKSPMAGPTEEEDRSIRFNREEGEGVVRVFIPDKDCKQKWVLFWDKKNSRWEYLQEMQSIK